MKALFLAMMLAVSAVLAGCETFDRQPLPAPVADVVTKIKVVPVIIPDEEFDIPYELDISDELELYETEELHTAVAKRAFIRLQTMIIIDLKNENDFLRNKILDIQIAMKKVAAKMAESGTK